MGERSPSDDAVRCLIASHNGSREALGEALESCRAYLLLVANRELANDLQAKGAPSDLVQETFLEAQRDFRRFQGDSPGEFRAWLREILLHNIANFARRYRETGMRDIAREVGLHPDDSQNQPADRWQFAATDPSPSADAMAAEQSSTIDAAIKCLPPDYRQIIELRYREGHEFAEIARLLDRTDNAVRKLFFRAVERLKQELGLPN